MTTELMDGTATTTSFTGGGAETAPPNATMAPGPWPGGDDALDRVRESLRAARQQVEGAVAVLRERGALNMDAAEAFTRARTLCRRAERRLAGACGALAPRPGNDGTVQ